MEALTVLQIMIARKYVPKENTCYLTHWPENLINTDGVPCTPFSMVDIQRYIDFFEFSNKLGARHGGDVVAKNMIIANIMANFCALCTFFSIRDDLIACRPLPVIKRKSGPTSQRRDDISVEESRHRRLPGYTPQLPPALRCRIQRV